MISREEKLLRLVNMYDQFVKTAPPEFDQTEYLKTYRAIRQDIEDAERLRKAIDDGELAIRIMKTANDMCEGLQKPPAAGPWNADLNKAEYKKQYLILEHDSYTCVANKYITKEGKDIWEDDDGAQPEPIAWAEIKMPEGK